MWFYYEGSQVLWNILFCNFKVLGHLLLVVKKVAEEQNINEDGYRVGKFNLDLRCIKQV